MLEVLFGGQNVERILQYLLARDSAYAREIALFYDVTQATIKKQLDKLEKGSIIVGQDYGNMRIYKLNQRNIYERTYCVITKSKINIRARRKSKTSKKR